MSHETVLVLGATGTQGGEVSRQLLAKGHQVHALTRNVASRPSGDLRNAGAQLFEGSFDNINALGAAAKGCTAMFLVVLPSQTEMDDARNAVEAAVAAGIPKCIYTSVANCEQIVNRDDFSPDITRARYFLHKKATQDLVVTKFRSWTILQPGTIMTNMIEPLARFFYSKLGHEHILHGAWNLDKKIGWIDPIDIGQFAVAAIESDRLDREIIPLVSDNQTLSDVAATMSEVAGQPIEAQYIGEEEVELQKDQNPLVTSAIWINKGWFDVDLRTVESHGIRLSSVKQFLQRQKESGLLEKTLQPNTE